MARRLDMFQTTVLIALICLTAGDHVEKLEEWSLGCYKDSPENRGYGTNMGIYNEYDMTIELCRSNCLIIGDFLYAGISEGRLCWCEMKHPNTMNTSLSSEVEGRCDRSCTGDLSEHCGGMDSLVSVFETPTAVLMSNLTLEFSNADNRSIDGVLREGCNITAADCPHNLLPCALNSDLCQQFVTQTVVDLVVRVATGVVESMTVDFGDGTRLIEEDHTLDTISDDRFMIKSHTYLAPGVYTVVFTATSDRFNTLMASDSIQVSQEALQPYVECPLHVPQGLEFECTVKAAGSEIIGVLEFPDEVIGPFLLGESEVELVGQVSAATISSSDKPNVKLHMLTSRVFHHEGLVTGWRINAAAAATIYLQVFRRNCPTAGQSYCYKQDTCLDDEIECTNATMADTWRRQCTSPNTYSFNVKKCVDTNGNPIEGVPSAASSQYAWAGETAFVIKEPGIQNIAIENPDDYIRVFSGDIIAVQTTGAHLHHTDTSYDVRTSTTVPPTVRTSEYSVTLSSFQTVKKEVQVEAYSLRLMEMRLIKVYPYLDGWTNVSFYVSNLFTDVNKTATFSVDSQVIVQNATFSTYWLEKTNQSHDFFIDEHNGSRVWYEWEFGDGFSEITQANYTNHTYTYEGIYLVTLTSWNNISTYNYSFELTVQDLIFNLAIEPWHYVSELGHPSQLFMNITQGTNVTYTIYIDDCFNKTIELFHDTDFEPNGTVAEHNGYNAWVNFTLPEIGNYTVFVNVSNYVNWMAADWIFPVGERIQNTTVHQIPTLPYGNSTTIILTLDNGTFTSFWLSLDGNLTRDWFICDWTNAWHNWLDCGMPYFEGDLAVTFDDNNGTVDNTTSSTTTVGSAEASDMFNYSVIEEWKWDDTYDECQASFGVGYVFLDVSDYMVIGNHTVTLTGWDLVTSDNVTTSMTWLISYMIENMVTIPNTTYVIPGHPVDFNMTLDQASHFDLFFDYNDTLFDTLHIEEMLLGDEVFLVHSWAMAGNYSVILTASNDVSEQSNDNLIYVQNPVENYVLTTDSPCLINYATTEGDAIFNITFVGGELDLYPTDAFHRYDYGTEANDTMHRYMNTYRNESALDVFSYKAWGNYSVTLNISNYVSHTMLYTEVIMDEEIITSGFTTDLLIINSTTVVTFTALLDFGSRINFTWDFDEGNVVEENYTVPRSISITHQYDAIGVWWPSLLYINSIDEHLHSLPDPIIVQYPVINFTIYGNTTEQIIEEPYWYITVKYDLLIDQTVDLPTNATLFVDFGIDGLTAGPLDMNDLWAMRDETQDGTHYSSVPQYHVWSQTITYYRGVRNSVSARIQNLVSDETFSVVTDIYEDITNESCKAYSVAPGTLPDALLGGFGLEQNYFPMEHSIVFEIRRNRGSHITFDWSWGDGHYHQQYDDSFGRHTYAWPGVYTMTMNMTNPLSHGNTTCTVHIQRSVGTATIFAETPISRNRTVDFILDPGTAGTAACYYIDYKDPLSEVNRYLFVGDMAECEKLYAYAMNLGEQRRILKTSAEMLILAKDPGYMIVDNFFWTLGTFEVQMHTFNGVSQHMSTLRLGVTRGPCQWPIVNISDTNICNNPSRCTNITVLGLNNIKQHYKSQELTIATDLKINCSSTKIAWFNWKVWKIDPVDNTSVLISENTTETDRVLIRAKHTLDYGLYLFRLNVSMDGEINIENVDLVYIEIIKTPLAGGIGGGAKRRKGWSKNVTFDALTEVTDPDDPNDPNTGYNCRWFCKRECEEWPIYNENYSAIVENYTHNCSDYTMDVDRGGCFLFDDIHEPGEFIPQYIDDTSPGTCQFVMDTYNTYELSSIEIRVVVTKDTRTLVASQIMDITQGDPPELFIDCVPSPCPDRQNYATKIKFTGVVKGSRPGIQYVWDWKLHWATSSSNVEDVTDYFIYYKNKQKRYDLPPETFSEYARPNSKSSAVSINSGLFSKADAPHKIAFIYLMAYRARGPSDNYGDNLKYFLINEPPVTGVCSVKPDNGTALDAYFYVECSEPFEDDHKPFKYEVRQSRTYLEPDDPAWEPNILFKGNTFGNKVQLKTGDKDNNYAMYYQLRCIDSIGSWTNLVIPFAVLPPPPGTLKRLIDTLNPADAATADPAVYAAYLKAIADLSLELVAPVKDCPPYPNAANYTDGEENEDYKAAYQVVDDCCTAFDEELAEFTFQLERGSELVISGLANMQVQTLDGATSQVSGLSSGTQDPCSMSSDTEDMATAAVTGYLNMLSNAEGLSATGVVAACQQSLSVSQQTLDSTGLTSLEGQEEDAATGTETEEGTTRRRRRRKRSARSGCKTTDSVQDGIMDQAATMGGYVADTLISGEDPTSMSTKSGSMTIDKQYVDGEGGADEGSSAGGTKLEFPPSSELVGEGNETSSTIQSSIVVAKTNPFIGKNATNNTMTVNSNVISINMMNDTGGKLDLGAISTPTHLFINREADKVEVIKLVNYAYSKNDSDNINKFAVHKVLVPAASSLHLRVLQAFNLTNCTITPNASECENPETSTPSWLDLATTKTSGAPAMITTTLSGGSTITITPAPTSLATLDQSTLSSTLTPYVTPPSTTTTYTTTSPTPTGWVFGENGTWSSENTTDGTTTPFGTETTTTMTTESSTTTMASTTAELEEQNENKTQWFLFIGKDRKPKVDDHDYNCSLPLLVDPVPSIGPNDTYDPDGDIPDWVYSLPTGLTLDLDTCFFDNVELNLTEDTYFYVGLKYILPNGTEEAVDFPTTPTLEEDDETAANATEEDTRLLYVMEVYSSRCQYWSSYTRDWETDGGLVGPYSTPLSSHCIFYKLAPDIPADYVPPDPCYDPTTGQEVIPPPPAPMSFGAAFVVPMNTIDFSNSAFNNLDDNPLIFSVMVSVMCLYLCILIWAKRQDIYDEEKAGTVPLIDNDPRDTYLYELTIHTGGYSRSGTTAKVSMIFAGEEDETPPRLIFDNKRPVLQRGSIDTFVMAVPRRLGSLNLLRAWHDNSGKAPSWFFSRISVMDLQTGETFQFVCERWLAVEEDDGVIDRVIPLAGRDDLTDFNLLFFSRAKKDFGDGHIWFSILGRPPKSRFTRCQRATVCLCLLFATMMANILFYGTGGDSTGQEFKLGPISFTIPQLMTGVYSSLIVFPLNLIVVLIFKKSASRPGAKWRKKRKLLKKRQKKLKEAQANSFADLKEEDEGYNENEWDDWYDDDQARPESKASNGRASKMSRGRTSSRMSRLSAKGAGKRTDSELWEKGTVEDQFMHLMEEKKVKTHQGFLLPWWFIYVGYLLSLGLVSVSFYVTVEIGGVFGPDKSAQWMVSFCTSFFESVLFTQPIKVVGIALVYALIIKTPPSDDEYEDRTIALKRDETFLHGHADNKNFSDPKYRKTLAKYKYIPLPPDENYLRAAKALRQKEIEMMGVIREIVMYVIFLYLLMMVGYGNRDPWANIHYNNLENMYGRGHYSGSSGYNINNVNSYANYWKWMKQTMVPAYFDNNIYDGNSNWWTEPFAHDMQNARVGMPRIRQLRINPTQCPMPIYKMQKDCLDGHIDSEQDTHSYRKTWTRVDESDIFDKPDPNWEWKSAEELDGLTSSGHHATYGGGGFSAVLGPTMDKALEQIEDLQKHDWIDERTRAVFIEFSLYNVNLNLFSISLISFEFIPTGGGEPNYQMLVMRLDRYVGPYMLQILVSEILTAVYVIYYLQREIRQIKKKKLDYFKEPWDVFEFTVLSMCVSMMVFFCYRLFLSMSTLELMRENKHTYVNMQNAGSWDQLYGYLLAFLVFLMTIKLLRLLRFNKKIMIMSRTLVAILRPLASFFIVFIIAFLAFGHMCYMIFVKNLFSFRTFTTSLFTLFSMSLNKFDYFELQEANPQFAPIIFLAFVMMISFVLINFLLTIILETYSDIQAELADAKNKYEIVDFIVSKFKGFIGIGTGPELPKFRSEAEGFIDDKDKELDGRVGELMDRFIEIVNLDPSQKRLMDDVEEEMKQKKRTTNGGRRRPIIVS